MSRLLYFRRSPRSVQRLCGEDTPKNLDQGQAALVISLACLSGWSAERISQTISANASEKVTPEEVWSYIQDWAASHINSHIGAVSKDNFELMKAAIKEAGIELEVEEQPMKPLYETCEPVTVPFVKIWSPKVYPQKEPCPGYTAAAREESEVYLMTQILEYYGELTRAESTIIARFGRTVEKLIKRLLRHWSREFKQLVDRGHPLRPLNQHDQVTLIMKYLDNYHWYWEKRFGTMAMQKPDRDFRAVDKSEILINSTGYGSKLLFGLMLSDRLRAVERLRSRERKRVCFDAVPDHHLEDGYKECYICTERLNVETAEGTKERAIRLAICCSSIIGEECLKIWLTSAVGGGAKRNDTCPVCRERFPKIFLTKLFGGEVPEHYVRQEADIQDNEDDINAAVNAREENNDEEVIGMVDQVAQNAQRYRHREADILMRWGHDARARRSRSPRERNGNDDFGNEG